MANNSLVQFLPMTDPAFVRDANLRHLLRTMRANIMAAHGKSGGDGFMPRAEIVAAAASAGDGGSSGQSTGQIVRFSQCVWDAANGAGIAGTHYLPLILPPRTVLIRAFCIVLDSLVGGGGATASIRAGDGAEEITVFSDSLLASGWAAGYHSTINIGQSAGARARAFKVVVAGGDVSAGRFRFYVEHARCEP